MTSDAPSPPQEHEGGAQGLTPMDTPDAVISAGHYGYGQPYGLDGPNWLRRLLRRLLRRRPATQRFLLRITYRDYRERCEVVHLKPGLIREFVGRLLAAETVRSVECAELLFKGRKSFGADYDPANLLALVLPGASPQTDKD